MAQTDLGKWMITNGGEYDPSVTYEQLTMVKYGNSTYITLKTVTGVTPDNDKINYQLMAQGFDATALSAVTAQDQQGLLGDKGSEVSAQSLIDALADKIMNTVIAKLGTGNLPSGMTDVISGLDTLYSNMSNQYSTERVSMGITDKNITYTAPFNGLIWCASNDSSIITILVNEIPAGQSAGLAFSCKVNKGDIIRSPNGPLSNGGYFYVKQ